MDNDSNVLQMIKTLNDTANGYKQSILLLTANKCGLFMLINDEALGISAIADNLNWDQHAAEIFLNALTAMGFLQKQQDCYSNTEISKLLLIKGAENYQGDILMHSLHLWESWGRVAETLVSGKPNRDPKVPRSPERWRAFIDGMSNIAKISAVRLWDEIMLVNQAKLIDIGGGPGTYCYELCERLPEIECVVFDLPEVKELFAEHRARAGMENRVSFHVGNVHTDPLPDGCDAALLSNVIHSWSEEQNIAVLKKLDEALPAGSLILIKDFFISEDGTDPLFSALFAINMLIGTEAGGCYSRSKVETWLQETAFVPMDFIQLTEQAGVLVAAKE
ncbi:MAG: methyltransferase [bacterium]